MKIAFPIPAFLRDGSAATITGPVVSGEFAIIGHRSTAVELWTSAGHWREDGSEHQFDIIAVQAPDGKVVPFGGLAT
ncbi:MAG TPA: hypothetical protein VII43_02240 [Opitutaceae bacterium]